MRDADWQAIAEVLRAGRPAKEEAVAALARIPDLRNDLDTAERRLIGLLRDHGVSWQAIAEILGLRSRQAAEQRWLRLSGAAGRDAGEARRERMRQRSADKAAGEEVAVLRAAAAELYDRLDTTPAFQLPRRTLQAALYAGPGALYDLAKLAVGDLSGELAGRLSEPARQALDRVRAALARG
jgi:DNA-binding transcriptional MerR regulator